MNNFSSLMIYMISFCASIFGANLYNKEKNIIVTKKKILYCILIIFPIVILQGFRYDVGTDYLSYANLVHGFSNNNTTFLTWYSNEPIFIIISKIAYLIGSGKTFFYFLIDALLMNIILFRIADYYKKEINITWLYIAYYMLCFPYFLNTERQGLAVIIVWMSTIFVREKKVVKFFLCILIATLIHNTAIIGLVFYLLNYINRNNKFICKFFLCSAISMPFLFGISIDFLSKRFAIFLKYIKFLNSGEIYVANVNFIYMLFLVLIIFILLYRYKGTKLDKFWVSFLCLLQVSSYLLNIYIEWGFRVSFYFQIGMMYAYAYILPKIDNKFTRYFFGIIYLICLLFYFLYKFYVQGNCEIFPYRFIWN